MRRPRSCWRGRSPTPGQRARSAPPAGPPPHAPPRPRGAPRRPPPPRGPPAGVRLAATAMALSVESGGAPARAIDGVATTLRANLAVSGELRAQSSQARYSGLVIALAPLAFGGLAMSTDPRTSAFLLRT